MLYAKLAVLIREVGALRVRRCGMSERSKVTCRMVNDAMFKSQGSSIRFLVCSFNVVFFWRKIVVIAPVYHIIYHHIQACYPFDKTLLLDIFVRL